MAVVAIAYPAVADKEKGGCGGWSSPLGDAMFMSGDIKFPAGQDGNYGQVNVGNDKAISTMGAWRFGADPVATNNLNIEKIQKSLGECKSCCEGSEADGGAPTVEFGESPHECAACKNACSLINLEQINVGSREAIALGPSTSATNNVNIKTVQV